MPASPLLCPYKSYSGEGRALGQDLLSPLLCDLRMGRSNGTLCKAEVTEGDETVDDGRGGSWGDG